MAGNPNPLVLAALLAGLGPLAIFAKAFAAIPLVLLGRWREMAWAAGLVVVTAPILPWGQFLASNERGIL